MDFLKLSADAGFAEKLLYGLLVAGIGMTIVFMVLITVTAVVYVFRLLFGKSSEASESAERTIQPSLPVTVNRAAGIPEESKAAAIASAAITAFRGESNAAFDIVSIRKI